MTIELRSLPCELQAQVVRRRHFIGALQLALVSRDHATILERAEELRMIAVNGLLAAEQAREQAEPGWQDIARTAELQTLAAAAGASLLDRAAEAVSRGEQDRRAFVNTTRRTLRSCQAAQPARQKTGAAVAVVR